eukprot:11013870-Prorocentrum_lima.AAC.1
MMRCMRCCRPKMRQEASGEALSSSSSLQDSCAASSPWLLCTLALAWNSSTRASTASTRPRSAARCSG